MTEVIETTIAKNVSFKLHSMDNSNLGYKIVLETSGHRMTIRNIWESCGLIQELVSCSCGFVSTEHPGGGCWQQGHDKKKSHKKMSEIHKKMYEKDV